MQMTKEEALKKIKELQQFIASTPDTSHPEVKRGQVYRHRSGTCWMVSVVSTYGHIRFEAVCVQAPGSDIWRLASTMPVSECVGNTADFTFAGMADALLHLSFGKKEE
jgi:hypothetical protein